VTRSRYNLAYLFVLLLMLLSFALPTLGWDELLCGTCPGPFAAASSIFVGGAALLGFTGCSSKREQILQGLAR